MAHKDIRIQFGVKDRRYEAVGFLNESESPVSGDEMFKRTADENGGAVGDEDEAFLSEHITQLPKELWPYVLVIGHARHRNRLEIVLYLVCDCRLYKGWDSPGYLWGENITLVVRRLP